MFFIKVRKYLLSRGIGVDELTFWIDFHYWNRIQLRKGSQPIDFLLRLLTFGDFKRDFDGACDVTFSIPHRIASDQPYPAVRCGYFRFVGASGFSGLDDGAPHARSLTLRPDLIAMTPHQLLRIDAHRFGSSFVDPEDSHARILICYKFRHAIQNSRFLLSPFCEGVLSLFLLPFTSLQLSNAPAQ